MKLVSTKGGDPRPYEEHARRKTGGGSGEDFFSYRVSSLSCRGLGLLLRTSLASELRPLIVPSDGV
jgi:hypothetical protein